MSLANISPQKLRGGFYTSSPLVNFLIQWGYTSSQDILEPSCVDGAFLRGFQKGKYSFSSLTAIEIESNEAQKARQIHLPHTKVLNQDFFAFATTTSKRFDLIIGNPPYVRQRLFTRKQQQYAQMIYKKAGIPYNKLTNAWASFVLGACFLLKEQGKVALVLPAELFQANYAKPIRTFLDQFFSNISIISFKEPAFPHIQQEVVLLLCEKTRATTTNIRHVKVANANELKTLTLSKSQGSSHDINFISDTWTQYFLSVRERTLMDKISNSTSIRFMRDYAEIGLGVTTGAKHYFSVPHSVAERYKIQPYTRPLVGRSAQAKSAIFTSFDWYQNIMNGVAGYLLVFPKQSVEELDEDAQAYIRYGQERSIDLGYQCRVRGHWYVVPSAWASEGLFTRLSSRFPRLIINHARASATDAMNRVQLRDGYCLEALTASFYNSLSFAFAELYGRSLGGGALDLPPNKVRKIPLPYCKEHGKLLHFIDTSLRRGLSIREILKHTDNDILKQSYGFSQEEVTMLNAIWVKLSTRRLNRRKR